MLAFAFTLGVMTSIVEMMFAANFKIWREAAYRYKAINMTISLLFAFIIGTAFGAGGLIAMTGGVISTVLSVPGYAFLHWNFDSERAQKLEKSRTNHMKQVASKNYEKAREVTTDVVKVGYVTARVVTAPIWIPRKITKKIKSFKSS
jgi:uncharacterized membrane protein